MKHNKASNIVPLPQSFLISLNTLVLHYEQYKYSLS